MVSIKKIDEESIPIIVNLAKSIWPIAYKNIISADQINYMLELMYSSTSLRQQMHEKKHQFILATKKQAYLGFSAYSPALNSKNNSTYRLHKLYVDTSLHQKGVGKSLLNYIIKDIKLLGATRLELNVNRHNKAVEFYKKMGFTIREEEVLQIGNGFVMDDYIMELIL